MSYRRAQMCFVFDFSYNFVSTKNEERLNTCAQSHTTLVKQVTNTYAPKNWKFVELFSATQWQSKAKQCSSSNKTTHEYMNMYDIAMFHSYTHAICEHFLHTHVIRIHNFDSVCDTSMLKFF